MTSLIAPVEILRQRPEAWWAIHPIGRSRGTLWWLVACVSCGKLRVCESSNIGRQKRCKACGGSRGILRREAIWYRQSNGSPVGYWFHDTDYGYDSTKLAVAESELMLGSVSAWYTEADAEACENWSPAESKRDHLQATTKVTKAAKKRMSVAAKKRWAKRREQKAQAAE